MPLQRSPIDCIEERELDLLLLAGVHSSARLRSLFVEKITDLQQAEFIGAWRGVCANGGESDLLVLIRAADGRRIALMIEDKINALFQPRQAQRYRDRGEAGIKDGHWDVYRTCLCAPKAYGAPYVGSPDWDAVLFLEDVEAALADAEAGIDLLVRDAARRACGKYDNPRTPPHAEATAFWKRYAALCASEFPDLRMSELAETQSHNDPWIRFARALLPPDVLLEHKAWLGRVDLTFKGRTADELRSKVGPLLPTGIDIFPAGRSVAVRFTTPAINSKQPFEPQTANVRAALNGVRAMIALWPKLAEPTGFASHPSPA